MLTQRKAEEADKKSAHEILCGRACPAILYRLVESMVVSNPVKLSVVLPCHNEVDNLPETLQKVDAILAEIFSAPEGAAEIVVVDDGSQDGTADMVKQQSGCAPRRIVTHSDRRGYGAAVRSGLAAASGDRVVYMDADGQYDPQQISLFMSRMDSGFDVVAGIRVDRGDKLHRRAIGTMYNTAIQIALGLNFQDVDCGFKLLSRHALNSIELVFEANLAGPEILLKAQAAGLAISQIPVKHTARVHGEAKGVDTFTLFKTGVDVVRRGRVLVRAVLRR
jgi:glycosyltransferase involved in cell wall biosynthesis